MKPQPGKAARGKEDVRKSYMKSRTTCLMVWALQQLCRSKRKCVPHGSGFTFGLGRVEGAECDPTESSPPAKHHKAL